MKYSFITKFISNLIVCNNIFLPFMKKILRTSVVLENVYKKKESIIDIIQKNSSIMNPVLIDDIYYHISDYITVENGVFFKISYKMIGINRVCITGYFIILKTSTSIFFRTNFLLFIDNTVINGRNNFPENEIRIKDAFTNNIIVKDFQRNFRYERTICVIFPFTFTKDTEIKINQEMKITEIDLLAESIIYKKG